MSHRLRVWLSLLGVGVGCFSASAWLAYQRWRAPTDTALLEVSPVDMNTARQEALASGRPLLIEFTANWCQPCNEMKAKTLSDPGVIRELHRYVLVSVDIDKNQCLMEAMHVSEIPTFFIADPKNGRVLKESRTGFLSPEFFLFSLSTDRK
jgi:thiol:disulfide interchange protein